MTRSVYDKAGRECFSVDGEGYVIERRYDAVGREIRRIAYANRYTVNDGASVASVLAMLSGTPAANEPVEESIYDAAGRLVDSIDAEGGITRHIYDAAGRETDTITGYGTDRASTTHRVFDGTGQLRQETVAYGTPQAATTRYLLDAVGNRTGIVDPRGHELAETDTAWALATRAALNLTTNGNPKLAADLSSFEREWLRSQYTLTQEFDGLGRVTITTDPLASNPEQRQTQIEYDAFGNKVKITDTLGYSAYFYYDQRNQAVVKIDPNGYAASYTYDAFGNVQSETQYSAKVLDGYTSATPIDTIRDQYLVITQGADATTTTSYDARGLVDEIIDANSQNDVFGYNTFGDKVSHQDRRDNVYNYEYDRNGELTREYSPAVAIAAVGTDGAVTTSNQRLLTEYSYDAWGNRTQVREAVGLPQQRITTFGYDKLHRVIRQDLPAIVVFDPVGKTNSTVVPFTTTRYDVQGNVVEEVDARGYRTLHYYDARNQRILSVDGEGVVREYGYDVAGNLTRERTYDTRIATAGLSWSSQPAPAATDTFRELYHEYDANNRRTATSTQVSTLIDIESLRSGASPYIDGAITHRTEYDTNGNIIKTIDGRGNATFYYYDALGQQVLQVDPLGYVVATQYDSAGRVVQETRYAAQLSEPVFADLQEDMAAVLSADLEADVVSRGLGQDRATQYAYDRLGRKILERTLGVQYANVDASGVLTTTEGDIEKSFAYDENGNLTGVTGPGQLQTQFSYDALNRLVDQYDPSTTVASIVNGALQTTTAALHTGWQYDALGNQVVTIRYGLTSASNQVVKTRYDAQGNQVAAWDALNNRVDFDIDANGNTLRMTRAVVDVDLVTHTYRTYYAYDMQEREISRQVIADEGAAGAVTGERIWSSYNAHGDIIARGIDNNVQHEYRYDKLGQLFWTNSETGTPRIYLYDANGNAVLEMLSGANDLSGIQSPEQARALSPEDVQITFSAYDARNQVTDVFQAPMVFDDLMGSLSASQEEQLDDPSTTSNNGAMAPTGSGPSGHNSYEQTKKTTYSNWVLSWSPPANGTSTTTPLNPTQINQATHGQAPLTLGTWTEGPTTYPNGPNSTRIVTKQTVRWLEGNTVKETITTTTDTTTTITSSSSQSTAPDEFDYETGTAIVGQQQTTTTTETITDRKVETQKNSYDFVQKNTVNSGVWGASAQTQLVYTAPQSIKYVYTCNLDPVNWMAGHSYTIPAIQGYGPGPARVLIEYGNGMGGWGTYLDNPNHTQQQTYAFLQVPGETTLRIRIWKDGALLVDLTANNPISSGAPAGTTPIPPEQWVWQQLGGYYIHTAPTVSVHGVASDVQSVKFQQGGQNLALSTRVYSTGVEWVGYGSAVGNAASSWQYMMYSTPTPSNSVLGGAQGGSLGNPTSRTLLQGYRTTTDYILKSNLNTGSNNYQDTDTVTTVQQRNYLRQLYYTLVTGDEKQNQIHRQQGYNAFGEIASETDGRGNETRYVYNELGKLVREEAPLSSYTNENGVKIENFTPTTYYHYDALGQLLAEIDAKGETLYKNHYTGAVWWRASIPSAAKNTTTIYSVTGLLKPMGWAGPPVIPMTRATA